MRPARRSRARDASSLERSRGRSDSQQRSSYIHLQQVCNSTSKGGHSSPSSAGTNSTFPGLVSREEVIQRLELEIRKNHKRLRHEPTSIYDLKSKVAALQQRLDEVTDEKSKLKDEQDSKLASQQQEIDKLTEEK